MLNSIFHPKNNNTITITIAILLLAGGTLALINYSQKNLDSSQAKFEDPDKFAKIREKKRLQKLKEEAAVKEARAKALAAAAEEKAQDRRAEIKLAEEQRKLKEQELLQAQKDAEAKAIAMQEKIIRDAALSNFIGTQYDTLEVEGKTYHKIKVTKATPATVTFSHQNGARTFQYSQLPKEISKLCKFCPKAAANYLAQNKKTTSYSRPAKPQLPQTLTPRAHKISKKTPQEVSIAQQRGRLTATVVNQSTEKHAYRVNSRYNSHYKTLRVIAKANTPAAVFNNGKRVKKLKAGVVTEFTVRSDARGKYNLELRSKDGKLLDKESHSRKSGLTTGSL